MSILQTLDPFTLLVVNATNVLVLAAALPVVMGRGLSAGARSARNTVAVQAFGWIMLFLANLGTGQAWLIHLLSTLAVAGFGCSNWFMFQALEGWLGPRPGRSVLFALVALLPVGYAVLFPNYALRVAWSNVLLAAQFLVLGRASLYPRTTIVGRWRWTLTLCALVMALLSLGRAILGGLYTGVYPSFMVPHPFNLAYMVLANLTVILINVSLLVGWREEAEQRLRDQTITDPLTTVGNRRGWDEAGARVFALARRHRQPLALLLLDLDHFKQINDRRGHEAGDAALRFFGKLLRREQRSGDIVARVGGEEFCIMLPMTDDADARAFDVRLRASLAATAVARLGHVLDYSAGLACLESVDDTLDALTRRADRALYLAKEAGRGRLVKV